MHTGTLASSHVSLRLLSSSKYPHPSILIQVNHRLASAAAKTEEAVRFVCGPSPVRSQASVRTYHEDPRPQHLLLLHVLLLQAPLRRNYFGLPYGCQSSTWGYWALCGCSVQCPGLCYNRPGYGTSPAARGEEPQVTSGSQRFWFR